MVILSTSTSAQTFSVTPRSGTGNPNKILLTNVETNATQTINITTYTDNDWVATITATFALTNNVTYSAVICKDSASDTRCRVLIFCTDQTDYTINENRYIKNSISNEFIVLR